MEYKMDPLPEFDDGSNGNSKLHNKKCVITGGDSGIGRAVAIAFAKHGADVAIIYLKSEEKDAHFTAKYIEDKFKRKCITIASDISKEDKCKSSIQKIIKEFTHIDVLVNNAAVQYPVKDISKITSAKMIKTFSVNIFAMFWITKASLPYMKRGSSIINTSSVTAYRGSPELLDYSATKGAIVSFTRSLSANLMNKGIRVNGVAPGPVWTPLIPGSFTPKKVSEFGSDAPMKRPAQTEELAPAYVFLASEDASYMSGQFIHVNGGEIVNG
ncbi:MAG: SDR family oxidoreductase [Burkholderiales bacterium]|nr:SDR family oxidoreductase [Bacteroidia bacterium]